MKELRDFSATMGRLPRGAYRSLVEKADLARSTVMAHLKRLEDATLVAKEEIIQGSVGRPKMLYKPTAKLLERAAKTKSD